MAIGIAEYADAMGSLWLHARTRTWLHGFELACRPEPTSEVDSESKEALLGQLQGRGGLLPFASHPNRYRMSSSTLSVND